MLTGIRKGFFLLNRKPCCKIIIYSLLQLVILLVALIKRPSCFIFFLNFPSEMGNMEGEGTMGFRDWESGLPYYC